MIDTEPKSDRLSQDEIEAITAGVKKTLSGLYGARESLAKKMIGRKTYKEATGLLDLVTSPEDPDNIDEEVAGLVDIIGVGIKQAYISEMHDLLQLELGDEAFMRKRKEAIHLASMLFPGEDPAYLLSKPEKLALLGAIMDDEVNMLDLLHEDERVAKLYAAHRHIDEFITALYGENTFLSDGSFEVEVSDVHFRITLDISQEVMADILASDTTLLEKEAKIASLSEYKNISIIDGVLMINKEPAGTRGDAQEIASILHCVPDITQKLKDAKRKFPKSWAV